jgi:CrcB protein
MVEDVDDEQEFPLDPDVDTAEDRRHHAHSGATVSPFEPQPRRRWPRIHWLTVAAVAGGGFFGGLVRYLAILAMPAGTGDFPWAVFIVNTAGAFILALLLILVLEVLPPTTYVRPALGTGFCGALTTFSSMEVSLNVLAVEGHLRVAAAYVLLSLFAGLAAASFGIVLGRSIAARREKGRK